MRHGQLQWLGTLGTYAATTLMWLQVHAPAVATAAVVRVHWVGASVGEADGLAAVEALLLHALPHCQVRCSRSRGLCSSMRAWRRWGLHACEATRHGCCAGAGRRTVCRNATSIACAGQRCVDYVGLTVGCDVPRPRELQELVLDLIGPDMRAYAGPGRGRVGRGAAQSRSIELPLCATCRARRRRVLLRLHACRYEEFSAPVAEDPDITAVFHPGFAADQPQEIEGGEGAKAGARKRRRAHTHGDPAAMPSLQRAWQPCFEKLASLTCPLLLTAFSFAGAVLQRHATHHPCMPWGGCGSALL